MSLCGRGVAILNVGIVDAFDVSVDWGNGGDDEREGWSGFVKLEQADLSLLFSDSGSTRDQTERQ